MEYSGTHAVCDNYCFLVVDLMEFLDLVGGGEGGEGR